MKPSFTPNRKLIFILTFKLFFFFNLQAQTPFTDVTVDVGVTPIFGLPIPLEHDGASVVDELYLGSGAAWFDYNNDNYLDLYITMRTGVNYLFQNNGPDINGDYSFIDVVFNHSICCI